MPSETFKLRVLTPMFMGGADSCGEPELRAASIRGAMRFWFRAIAGAVTSDPKEVYRLESEVFGNTEQRSKVVVRVVKFLDKEKQNELIMKRRNPLKEEGLIPIPRNLGSLVYLANMGLVRYYSRRQLEKANSQNPPGFYWDRGAFLPGYEFLVEIMVTSATVKELITNVLKIAVFLGGFGARWRHGFGSCEIIEENGSTPEPIDLFKLRSYLSDLTDKLENIANKLEIPLKRSSALPLFTTFSEHYFQIWEKETDPQNWKRILDEIGKVYREFRIGDGNHNHFGHTWEFLKIVKAIFEGKQVKSNDPKNDIFGLPIQISKQYGRERKTAIINVHGKEINRRASPLILHVEPNENKSIIRATLFISKFIPDDAEYSVDIKPDLSLIKPKESDYSRIVNFLTSIGLTRVYPKNEEVS